MHIRMEATWKYGTRKVRTADAANTERNEFDRRLFRSSVQKEFDKEAKFYLYNIEGQNASIRLPAADSHVLSLHQRYLVLHILVPLGSSWSLELGLTDLGGVRRRMNMTTLNCKQESKYFSLRYSIENVERGKWLFLAVDVYSCMEGFKDQVFRSLDHIVVGSTCKLRRIFTMKDFVEWEIPKAYWFPSGISLQLITYHCHLLLSRPLQPNKTTPQKQDKSLRIQRKDTYLPKLDKISPFSHLKDGASSEINTFASPPPHKQKITNIFKPARPTNIFKSNVVNNAQLRLSMLQKKEQEIIQKSKKQTYSTILSKDITLKKQDILHLKEQRRINKSDKLTISRVFKEDEAYLNVIEKESESESSIRKEKPKMEEEKWSDEQKQHHLNRQQQLTHSFPTTVITLMDNKQVQFQNKKETELQLIFDEMVGCYYHPQTNTYYQIKS